MENDRESNPFSVASYLRPCFAIARLRDGKRMKANSSHIDPHFTSVEGDFFVFSDSSHNYICILRVMRYTVPNFKGEVRKNSFEKSLKLSR
jgi:hypothetical protein